MNLKAGNIFLTKVSIRPTYTGVVHHPDSADYGFEDWRTSSWLRSKSVIRPRHIGERSAGRGRRLSLSAEGYSARRFLQSAQGDDIFSLGITLHGAAGGGPLPNNGDNWHQLQSGNFPDLLGISRDFNKLIEMKMNPDSERLRRRRR